MPCHLPGEGACGVALGFGKGTPSGPALGEPAEGCGVVVGSRVGGDHVTRQAYAADRFRIGIVGWGVETEIHVCRLQRVDRPLAHGRKSRRQILLGHQFLDDAVALLPLYEPPPVVGQE
ncbi:MAG: hypothetical protein GX174_13300 [Lentisphaerae bacterium]|nr:hypothetical protein [Lentisphaerota bacterium]